MTTPYTPYVAKPKVCIPLFKRLLTTDGKGRKDKILLLKAAIRRANRKLPATKALNWLADKGYRIIKYDDGFIVVNPAIARHSTIAIGETPLKAVRNAMARKGKDKPKDKSKDRYYGYCSDK